MSGAVDVTECRVCGNRNLVEIVNLGTQYLSGVFPTEPSARGLSAGPLRLLKCHGGQDVCGLVQLDRTFDLAEMYGETYGYRSGLNAQMVEHLRSKVAAITGLVQLKGGDLVVDIGANDGTTLGFYRSDLELLGIDPSGEKFRQYYKPHVKLVPEFFSASLLEQMYPGRLAKVVTSFSMFYDLPDPIAFATGVASVLDPADGIWVFEQSYMPTMLARTAYDTICHEHLEYYGLRQVQWILEHAGLKLVDVELNDVNGGSFSVVAARVDSKRVPNTEHIEALKSAEQAANLMDLDPYRQFSDRIVAARTALVGFLAEAHAAGKTVAGLGASTKGNVVLQYCGFGPKDISEIGEVNPDKFGAFTPGTSIPICEQSGTLARRYDYLVVLPWHFRSFFASNPAMKGQTLVFPLPELEVVKL